MPCPKAYHNTINKLDTFIQEEVNIEGMESQVGFVLQNPDFDLDDIDLNSLPPLKLTRQNGCCFDQPFQTRAIPELLFK